MQTAELENWIKALPVEEVRAQVRDLELQLARAKQALALYESLANGTAPATADPQGGSQQTLGTSPSKPAAIASVLRDHHPKPLTTGEIFDALVANGWIPDEPRKRKGFYATMSRLNGEGRILRHPDGGYTLPPDSQQLS